MTKYENAKAAFAAAAAVPCCEAGCWNARTDGCARRVILAEAARLEARELAEAASLAEARREVAISECWKASEDVAEAKADYIEARGSGLRRVAAEALGRVLDAKAEARKAASELARLDDRCGWPESWRTDKALAVARSASVGAEAPRPSDYYAS
jgi:hypothetical protein